MKPIEEVVACVVDYGTFMSVAQKLAEKMHKVYYHTPYQTEYQDVRNVAMGMGVQNIVRCDDFMDPEVLDEIDLFVFPDIGFGGLQKHLRSIGKAVWGHMGADELELLRDKFIITLSDAGLPIIPNVRIMGISALARYLKTNTNKWIKVNRFRANMETWHHKTFATSQRILESLAVIFGGAREHIVFIVQDDLESEQEIGYDGWCIDGEFPEASFQGYEKKNELYIGSFLAREDLPEEVETINRAMSPVLKSYGYRCWWATEIRVADGRAYFIDPTPRMPGQTGEHQLETIENIAEVIWEGANGNLIAPIAKWKFAAEATLHFDDSLKDSAVQKQWNSFEIPKTLQKWVKLYRACYLDNMWHATEEEIGVLLGVGDSYKQAISDLEKKLKLFKGTAISAHTEGFSELITATSK